MQHPFEQITVSRRQRVFWVLVALTLLVEAVFMLTGSPLTTDAAPAGIVSFELAATTPVVESILASWDAVARERAAFIQGLDFLFIPLYAAAIGLGCIMAADTFSQKMVKVAALGRWLAWGLILAGLLDVVENISLLVMLFVAPAQPWALIAAACAVPKFALVLLGLLYALLGGVTYLFRKM
ncbi:MAG: hypothetical protein H8E28_06705 [Anaerolineae bacterium]|nr:hypothetical protein [Anaerolineae bacterium]MBL6966010.1 hypothetical protein [Anaerolineales bacterium]